MIRREAQAQSEVKRGISVILKGESACCFPFFLCRTDTCIRKLLFCNRQQIGKNLWIPGQKIKIICNETI